MKEFNRNELFRGRRRASAPKTDAPDGVCDCVRRSVSAELRAVDGTRSWERSLNMSRVIIVRFHIKRCKFKGGLKP